MLSSLQLTDDIQIARFLTLFLWLDVEVALKLTYGV